MADENALILREEESGESGEEDSMQTSASRRCSPVGSAVFGSFLLACSLLLGVMVCQHSFKHRQVDVNHIIHKDVIFQNAGAVIGKQYAGDDRSKHIHGNSYGDGTNTGRIIYNRNGLVGYKNSGQIKPCEGSGNDGHGAGAVGVVCCMSPKGPVGCDHAQSGGGGITQLYETWELVLVQYLMCVCLSKGWSVKHAELKCHTYL